MSESKEYVLPSSNAPVAELGDASATTDSHEPLKICLILTKGAVAWLDHLANQKGCQLNRSSVTRAIITGFSRRGIKFSAARTENDIAEMVGRCLDFYLNSRARAKTDSKPAAPAPRPPQATAGTNHVGAGNGSGKTTTQANSASGRVDEDSESALKTANEIFDNYMRERGKIPCTHRE
jgi:hypothetical protein